MRMLILAGLAALVSLSACERGKAGINVKPAEIRILSNYCQDDGPVIIATGYQFPHCSMDAVAVVPGAFAGWCEPDAPCRVPILFKGNEVDMLSGAPVVEVGDITTVNADNTHIIIDWHRYTGTFLSASFLKERASIMRQKSHQPPAKT